MSKVELYERIRREHRLEGTSIRQLARRHGVHRRLVREALASATPRPRKTPERLSPALGEHEATIRRWLTEDLQVRPKQRHTARRIWQRLVTECDAQVAESTVRARVAEIRAELEQRDRDVSIVQEHAPGAEAEVEQRLSSTLGSTACCCGCGCFICGCRARADRSRWRSPTRRRRRSSRGMCSASRTLPVCPPGCVMTT